MSTLMAITPLAHDHWNGPGAWWPIFPIFWGLFWIVVIGFIIFRVRRGGGPPWRQWQHQQSGEGVLAERYARGEIDEREYEQRLGVLRKNRPEK